MSGYIPENKRGKGKNTGGSAANKGAVSVLIIIVLIFYWKAGIIRVVIIKIIKSFTAFIREQMRSMILIWKVTMYIM